MAAYEDALSHLPVPKDMTTAERDHEVKQHLKRLKELRAVPRSDWHREFEDVLLLDIDSWNNNSYLERVVSIGEDAPRADYIIVTSNGLPDSAKAVFRIFRRHNVIEYKRPGDLITRRTIWKTGGYGNLLLGTTKEDRYPEDELTLTIFSARKNSALFSELMEEGILRATETQGIYQVVGITKLPYQIVITDELEGSEYAAYRALTDHAQSGDVVTLLAALKAGTGETRDRYHRILELIERKNPGAVAAMIEEDREMESIFLKVLEPRINEIAENSRREGVKEGAKNATINNLYLYVQDGDMPLDRAAKRAGLDTGAFLAAMKSAGYTAPNASA